MEFDHLFFKINILAEERMISLNYFSDQTLGHLPKK